MLVLDRKLHESIRIGNDIKVTVVKIEGESRVRLRLEAPHGMKILRSELKNEEPPKSPKS